MLKRTAQGIVWAYLFLIGLAGQMTRRWLMG